MKKSTRIKIALLRSKTDGLWSTVGCIVKLLAEIEFTSRHEAIEKLAKKLKSCRDSRQDLVRGSDFLGLANKALQVLDASEKYTHLPDVIRWMGAFRKGAGSLHEALGFEFRDSGVKAATTCLLHDRLMVGLGVKQSAILKRHDEDVWSMPTADGRLKASRDGGGGGSHDEIFVKPVYSSILVPISLGTKTKRTCEFYGKKHKLPVFYV
jgi:hypothetical protein